MQIKKDKNNALIVEKRNLTMKQMKDSNNEVKQLETEILDIGLKTQTLKEQNDKFIQAIQNIELEFKSIENEVNESEQDEKSLRKEYYRLNSKYSTRSILIIIFA
jgi:chromosome segregation ATPase